MLQTIFKSTILLTVAQLTQRLGTVVLTFVISRWLGVGELGVYATALGIYGLLGLASELGAKSYLVREIAKRPEATAHYLLHIGMVGWIVSCVLVGLGWMVIELRDFSAELTRGLNIVLLALPAATLYTFVQSAFIAHQRVVFITYALFVLNVVKVGVSAMLLWNGGGAADVLLALVVGEWVTLIVSLLFLRRSIPLRRRRFDFNFIREMLGELKIFALLSLLAGLFAQPEVLMITWLINEEASGYFAAAYKLVTLWLIVPDVTMTNVFPYLSRAYADDSHDPIKMQSIAIKYLLIVCLPIALGMMAAAEPIIHLFYGDGYMQAVRPLQLMALLVPFNALIDVCWRILAARHQQHLDLQVRIGAVAFRLIVGYVAIARWGIEGAAVTALASLLLTLVLMLMMVQRDGAPLPIVQQGWRTLLAASVMGGTIFLVRNSASLVLIVAVAGILYAGLVLLWQVLSRQEVHQLWLLSFGRNKLSGESNR